MLHMEFVQERQGGEDEEFCYDAGAPAGGGGTSLNSTTVVLSAELVYALVLTRVDALTLAKASCVSREFRALCADEALWESLCTARWPSTKEAHVKSIVSSMGGFRKLYAACYPLILTKGSSAETSKNVEILWKISRDSVDSSTSLGSWADSCTKSSAGSDHVDELDGSSYEVEVAPEASDFISIIDVVYNGESVLSRTIEGIPETGDFVADWFSVCPFSFDVLRDLEETRDSYGFSDDQLLLEPRPDQPGSLNNNNDAVATTTTSRSAAADHLNNIPVIAASVLRPVIKERTNDNNNNKKSKLDLQLPWKTLQENMRMSWILMKRSTKQMTNLASWKPLEGGTCGWPYEQDFVLQFGSILPATTSSSCASGSSCSSSQIQCDIVLKSKLSTAAASCSARGKYYTGHECSGEFFSYNSSAKMTTEDDHDQLQGAVAAVWIVTELSMQLKNMEGATLNGRDSLLTLSTALTATQTHKTRDHCKLLESYHACLSMKSQLKDRKIRQEARLDTAIAISGICVFICLNYFFFFYLN